MFDELKIFDKAFKCINQNVPLITLFKKKPKFEKYITLALKLSSLDTSIREKIGVFWIDDKTFALKTTTLAHSIGLKPNSINCSLRQHQLKKIGKVPLDEIKDFDNKLNWKIIQDKQCQFTRTKVEKSGNSHLLQWIKPKKQIENQEQTYFNIDMLTFEQDNNLSQLLDNNEKYFNIDEDIDEQYEIMFDSC